MPRDAWIEEHGFSEVVAKQEGIFDAAQPALGGTSAMSDYNKARTAPTKDGLLIEFQCENCGKERKLYAEYPELIAIKYGLQPHVAYQPLMQRFQIQVLNSPVPWGYDQEHQMWFPDLRCQCGWPLRPLLSLQEAESALRAAVQRGWFRADDNKKLSDHCFAMSQARQNGG